MFPGKTSRVGVLALLALSTVALSGCILSSEDKDGTVGDHAGPNTPVTVENAQAVFGIVFGTIKTAFDQQTSKPAGVSEERTFNGSSSGKIVMKIVPTATGRREEITITDFSNDGELFIGGKLTNDLTTMEHGETGAIEGNLAFAGLYKGSIGVDVMMDAFEDFFMVQGMVKVGTTEVPVYFQPMHARVSR